MGMGKKGNYYNLFLSSKKVVVHLNEKVGCISAISVKSLSGELSRSLEPEIF